MKLTMIGVTFMLAVGTLVWVGYLAGSIPHYSIAQVTSPSYVGEECRIDGATVLSIESRVPLRFTVESEGGATLSVVSERNPPDNFKVGGMVGMRGFYRKGDAHFEANEVLTSCPSKYDEKTDKTKKDSAPLESDLPATIPGMTGTGENKS